METKYYTFKNLILILLLISLNSHSQNHQEPYQHKALQTKDVRSEETLEDFTTYLFMNSLIVNEKFIYRKLLKESRQNPKTILIDTSFTMSSTALLKVFKKATNKSDGMDAFKSILFEKIPSLKSAVTDHQLEQIYASFRASTFNGYLDEVRLALGTD
ncbi:hypothetical protein [Winogradskyella sp.]|uniref:hypothetical protein n=1 Tax=Winogradskyella sp. TaxID=1883156 RepID=UPI0026391A4B|nr:hypothetical protein [Winogradskyella sp.]